MSENFFLGMAIIVVAGAFNGCFSVPMKFLRRWQWENLWLVFSTTSQLLLPVLFAVLFVPHLREVYQTVPGGAFVLPMAFGVLWGICQATFGLALHAVGMAIGIAIVSGLCSLIGSFIPLIVLNPSDLFRPKGLALMVSMPILFVGLYLYAQAGRRREKEQSAPTTNPTAARTSAAAGLALAIFTGLFGSSFNLGFAFAAQVNSKSLELGASPLTSTYAVWAIVLGAGFIPNLLYSLYLLTRRGTWALFAEKGWLRDALLALAMAGLWFTAIYAYGIGARLAGRFGTSLGFAVFSATGILAANFLGILTGEWKNTSHETRKLLAFGLAAVLLVVILINLGGLF